MAIPPNTSAVPLRVAHVYLSMPVGGAEDLTLGVMQQSPAEIKIVPVCLRELGPVGEELKKQGKEIHLLPVAPSKRFNLFGVFRLAGWLREQGFAAVHTQVYNAHVYGLLAAWKAGIPGIMHHQKTFRGMKPHRLWMMKWLTRLAPAQITLSAQTKQDVCQFLGARPERVAVLPNAVDTTLFRPPADRNALRRQLQLPEHEFTAGTVASLTAPKNHSANLQMWAEVRRQGLAGRFLLCGEGGLRDDLTRLHAQLQLPSSFTFLGNQRPVHPWVQAMDVFVLCSTWEGQPLAILQALACGKPVLASRIEGNVAVLGEAHPGLFDLEKPGDYAEKLLRAWREPAYREEILEYQAAQSPRVPSVRDCARAFGELYQRLHAARDLDGIGDLHL
ncbi:MAG: glycosyltransferase [Verrucomicrobiota bacterium]